MQLMASQEAAATQPSSSKTYALTYRGKKEKVFVDDKERVYILKSVGKAQKLESFSYNTKGFENLFGALGMLCTSAAGLTIVKIGYDPTVSRQAIPIALRLLVCRVMLATLLSFLENHRLSLQQRLANHTARPKGAPAGYDYFLCNKISQADVLEQGESC